VLFNSGKFGFVHNHVRCGFHVRDGLEMC
jgi:hypothetical protein